jgi:hypothetical protein
VASKLPDEGGGLGTPPTLAAQTTHGTIYPARRPGVDVDLIDGLLARAEVSAGPLAAFPV